MPARTIATPENLPNNVSKIFEQAQTTSANHQKNFVALHKLHSDAATHTEDVQNGKSTKLTGERMFEDTFIDMLSRVLPVKKGASVADRIMKFIGGYLKFINEKAIEERQKREVEEDDEDDTTASRFVSRVLRYLCKGCVAKDKTVRFRVLQCIAEMISHLGEIDEDLYVLLRSSLLERIRDKEVPVRVQAVIALSKICGSDGPDESPTVLEVLLDTLCYDTSADVRRATLINIAPTADTLPTLLSRTRDVDPTVRKLVYSSVLNPHDDRKDEDQIGLMHPRVLTIAQRELIVRNGLGDREDGVKSAAAKLLSSWVDVVRSGGVKHEGDEEDSDLIAFLRLFDLAENQVPEDALLSVFTTRPDILDSLEFGDTYWNDLTPEKAFLVRVFADHCVATKDDTRLESSLPVVTALAYKIQASYNESQEAMQSEEEERLLRGGMEDPEEDERRVKREEERLDREFVIGEMLKLAVNLDYADEIGRRKMFQLVRDMISQDALPESLVARCLDVLRILSPNERDLIRVVVEVVHELRDPSDEDEQPRDTSVADDGETNFGETPATVKTVRALPKPVGEMSPEEKARVDAIDLRCLSLCIGMLERVNGTFEENSTLEGILGELIVPAVKRKELALREKGLVSLGLCCLIARRMALNSFQLFLNQVTSAPEVLKLRVLQVVFDILMVQEGDFLGPGSTNSERITDFILQTLENEESEKVQALLCIGISKLMLAGMILDERVLRSLVLIYMSPETADNQELRQCLSYFFPVYCYSSATNQRRIQKVFTSVYEQLCEVYKGWDGDEEMITPGQAGLMFVDWTDPQKAVVIAKGVPGHKADMALHIDLASDIIKLLFNDNLEKDEKKGLCQLLGKLHIPEIVDDDKVRTLNLLMLNLRSRRPLRDTASKNAFIKFQAAITGKFEEQLKDFSEDEYRQLEYLKDLFEFLDEIIPDFDDEEEETPKKRGGRKRRSQSVATDATSNSAMSGDDRSSTASKPTRGKGKSKRRRLSTSDDEDDEDASTQRGDSPPTIRPPTRVMPRRSAAEKTKIAVAKNVAPLPVSEEEEEDDDNEDSTPPPPPRRKSSGQRRTSAKVREEARLDAEIDELLDDDGEEPHDSIMDTAVEEGGEDEEDEEDEVVSILG